MGTRHYIRGRLSMSAKLTAESSVFGFTLAGNNGGSFFFKMGTTDNAGHFFIEIRDDKKIWWG